MDFIGITTSLKGWTPNMAGGNCGTKKGTKSGGYGPKGK